MEYASGGELFDYIVARSRLKEPQACQFLQQILAGVEYLQLIRVVHRDLKPENLLLDSKNTIKIVDFGLSNMYKADETLKTACGSPCYAAPEMIAGKKYHGAQVDIWSCGVILFAMLNGYLPFEDPNTSCLYKKIIAGEYRCGGWVSNEAQDLLKNILNTNPDNRFTIEKIRSHSWFSKYSNKNIPRIFPSFDTTTIDESIIKQMENMGLNADVTRESISKNKHNKYTSTYFLLLKRAANTTANEALNAKIASPAINPPNPRGDSHSINPRIKKIFEFKGVEKPATSAYKEVDNVVRLANKTVVREVHYIRPSPRRRIYGNSPNSTFRDPRAASTGFQGIRTGAYAPREIALPVPGTRRAVRPSNTRTPYIGNDLSISINSSVRGPSPRAGTALDVSIGKFDKRPYAIR